MTDIQIERLKVCNITILVEKVGYNMFLGISS